MKKIILALTSIILFTACKKEATENNLIENQMIVKGTTYTIYRSNLFAYTSSGCPNSVAAITSYAANTAGDSCYMYFYNLENLTEGSLTLVEPFISGSSCRCYVLGGYKKAGQSTYTTTNSTFSGKVNYNSTFYKLEEAQFYDRRLGGLTTYNVSSFGKF
ncbi:MAG: hypothetical protein ACOVO1_12825 [Chitinophagaceae bacterium]